MRKLDPFTLIYDGAPPPEPEKSEAEAPKVGAPAPPKPASSSQKTVAPPEQPLGPITKPKTELDSKFDAIDVNPDLRRTLVYTSEAKISMDPHPSKVVGGVDPVVKELERQAKVTTVALWDLDARVGNLPALIKPLNKSQTEMTFFELQGAPLSAGLLGRPEFMIEWIRSKTGLRLSKSDREDIGENLNSNDFYDGAAIIQKRTGVDYLVGITPFMIAGESEAEVFWNRFSNAKGRLLLVSTHGIREYSEQAGRPVEVGIAMIMIAALAVAMNRKLNYHDGDDTGCLVDHNMDRNSIVECIRDLKIDDECLKKFEKKNREPFLALLESLRNYKDIKTADVEVVDNNYWLDQLDKLSEAKS